MDKIDPNHSPLSHALRQAIKAKPGQELETCTEFLSMLDIFIEGAIEHKLLEVLEENDNE